MKRSILLSSLILSSTLFVSADLGPEPAPEITEITSTSFNIDWDGTLGNTYFIQYSADLISWDYMPIIKSGIGGPLGYGFDAAGGKLFLRLHYTDIPTSNPSTDDFDGDGISNWDEVRLGGTHTSPLIADTNGDGIRDDGLVFAAQNDPDGAALPSSLDVGLTGRWDFEQLNGNSYTNKANASYPAIVGGVVPIDNAGIVSKASKYSNNGDWLKIDPDVFTPNSSNSISLWFSFEKDWVQNKTTIYTAASRTAFWSYNSSNTAYPKLVPRKA